MLPAETALDTAPSRRPDLEPRRWWRLLPVFAAALVFIVLVPVLEINDSHLVNPDWPPHARLHEAWQLLTNAALGAAAAWLAWVRRERLGAGLALFVVGPVLMAYALRSLYGGSMNRQGGEDAVFTAAGAPVIVMLVIAVGLLAVISTGGSVQGRREIPDLSPT